MNAATPAPTLPPADAGATGQAGSWCSSFGAPWKWPRLVLIGLLRAYKRFLSPLLPPSCRFTPTCSEYAIEAVGRHGIFKGSLLSCWRLFRCNPFCRGGYDPVP
ncbi:MAG: membrane protein insertion efficiency factor YidD [Desulfobulbaceae bacterium]|nr:membrane protein insertion efficiency factor YidD [Desulfobulbaceae bacterium]